jgi:anti-sigma factor RsiW
MTEFNTTSDRATADCVHFEAQLSDYLEGTLLHAQRAAFDAHRRDCDACAALVQDLERLVADAGSLPPLTPSHDLWNGIAERLDTDVTPLTLHTATGATSSTATAKVTRAHRTVSVRTLAIAATLLVAVTSGVTWRLARVQRTPGLRTGALAAVTPASTPATASAASSTTSSATVPTENAMRAGDSVIAPPQVDAPVPTRLVASSPAEVDDIYEREISALRRVVDERFTELDSTTVAALRRNLAIIDEAIADSRRALQRDFRSRLLSSQLDRAIETKLALMRRVALL